MNFFSPNSTCLMLLLADEGPDAAEIWTMRIIAAS